MEIVGNPDITKQMMMIRKRELEEARKPLLAKRKSLIKQREKWLGKGEPASVMIDEIKVIEKKLCPIENELAYYSAKFEPVRLFDVVINYKLLKQILQKTKKLNVTFEKGDNETIIISWDVKGSNGRYTLNNLATFYKHIMYIPELIIQE